MRSKSRRAIACAAFVTLALRTGACVAVPADLHAVRSEEGAPVLAIVDYAGTSAMPLHAPRLPRLRVSGLPETFWETEDEIAWLFEGAADDALRSDLERAPLLAEHRERALPCSASWRADTLELLPEQALPPDASYVLALAAWAREDEDEPPPLLLEIRTSADAADGARVTATWPAAGSVAVGTDLPFAAIALDGAIEGAERGVWLEGPDGLAVDARVEVGACDVLWSGADGASCVRVEPRAALAPLSPHRLVLGDEARDRHGAPIGPFAAAFRTAAGPDAVPPQAIDHECAVDEQSFPLGCALISDRSIALRVRSNEPFAATLELEGSERVLQAIAPAGDASARLDGLSPGETVVLAIALRDSTGNTTTARETFTTYADLPSLSITETRADPRGPEPSQELVELWNFGAQPIALAGMSLSDDAAELGTPLTTAHVVDPGARVLLVADAFDEHDPSDPALPPGTPLVRVGKSLGSAGLANRGEALYLRDALGRRVSASPATPPPIAGACSVRVSDDPRDGSPGSFAIDPDQSCTPGW